MQPRSQKEPGNEVATCDEAFRIEGSHAQIISVKQNHSVKALELTLPYHRTLSSEITTQQSLQRIFFCFLVQSPKFPILNDIAVVMLYCNSASNPILYNICNEQFRDGFKQCFKPCLRTLCPGMYCKEEEYSNKIRESDCISLVYSPKTRLSTVSQISSTRTSNCMTVSFNDEKTMKSNLSTSSFV